MRRVAGVLAALMLVGGLAWVGLDRLVPPVDIGPIAPQPGQTAPAQGRAALKLRLDGARLADFPETLSRPLFWASRRPAEAPPATAAAQSAPPGAGASEAANLRLAGVMRVGSGKLRALLVSPEQPAGQWLEEGGVFGGWRLAQINPGGVALEAGGRRTELKLP